MKEDFFKYLEKSIEQDNLVKITLSHYKGRTPDMEKILVYLVEIRGEKMLSFVYRFTTQDHTKNFPIKEGIQLLHENLHRDFKTVYLNTTDKDYQLTWSNRNKRWKMHFHKPSSTEKPKRTHDREKNRVVKSEQSYLYHLGITTTEGKVKKDKNDKYKQINKFIEIIDAVFKTSDAYLKPDIKVVDMGSGKSYLTFALYDYLVNKSKTPAKVVGVEQRQELVDFSNELAEKCGFKRLKFEQGTIKDANTRSADMVVALHACDTATDDAIFQALKNEVEIIILAPCCQHYVRKNIRVPEQHKALFKNGIHKEQMSVLLTDALRGLTLESFGYKTKIFEFISPEHTAKNVMISAVRNKNMGFNQDRLMEINQTKMEFGVPDYYLDTLVFGTGEEEEE